MSGQNDDILLAFIAESRDAIDDIDPMLVAIERCSKEDSLDPEMLNTVFRVFHTIKGSAAFLQLDNIVKVNHKAETLLAQFRKGEKKITSPHIDMLCRTCDCVRSLLDKVESDGSDSGFEEEVEGIISELETALSGVSALPKPECQEPKKEAAKPKPAIDIRGQGTKIIPKPESPIQSAPKPSPNGQCTDELMLSFTTESREMLEGAELALVELEQGIAEGAELDPEQINKIFRAFHTIKGSASFLSLNNTVDVMHKAETLLDLFRKEKIKILPVHTEGLLRTCDLTKTLLDRISEIGSDAGLEEEVLPVIEMMSDYISGKTGLKVPVSETQDAGPAKHEKKIQPQDGNNDTQVFITEAEDQIGKVEAAILEVEKNPARCKEFVADAYRNMHSFKGSCGFSGYDDLVKLSQGVETVFDGMKKGNIQPTRDNISVLMQMIDVFKETIADIAGGGKGNINACDVFRDLLGDMVVGNENSVTAEPETPKQAPPEIAPAKPAAQQAPNSERRPSETTIFRKQQVRRDIRVDLDKLDSLINLVGELVIAEAMVVNNPDILGIESESFERSSDLLNRVVRELQDMAMAIRMIPISGTFQKMIRLVRDLSSKSGKKVKLELKGEETEIDKTVAEQIADPLVHIIRNAIDHGLETPDVRLKNGKDESGTLTLEAKHEGGEIWILIRDDGRGLNKEKILAKGIERGLVRGDGSGMSDGEIFNLVFEPGFSTADKVTDISGRGVGMDVVKKNIEKLKGRIEIKSKLGQGAMFILRIPLTLAIIEGMLVRVGHDRYTIPMLAIKETIKITTEHVVNTMDSQEIVRLRDELIPVVRLHKVHNITPDSEKLSDGILIILNTQDKTVGVFVDEILGQHQAVIKGLSKYMGNSKSISGCTILGDGDVSLILDPVGVVGLAEGE